MFRVAVFLAGAALIACSAGCATTDTTGVETQIVALRLQVARLREREAERALVESIRAEFSKIEGACSFYQIMNGDDLPDFAAHGWDQLIDSGFLKEPPANPLSPEAVASTLIVVDTPEMTGFDVDPTEVGWIFSRDFFGNVDQGRDMGGVLYAAGYDGWGLLLFDADSFAADLYDNSAYLFRPDID